MLTHKALVLAGQLEHKYASIRLSTRFLVFDSLAIAGQPLIRADVLYDASSMDKRSTNGGWRVPVLAQQRYAKNQS